ncbi:hypothetical protein AB0K00_30370 [Dactylosporangium sp. NPDC049525]
MAVLLTEHDHDMTDLQLGRPQRTVEDYLHDLVATVKTCAKH